MPRPWQAQMIAADDDLGGAPQLRGEFTLAGGHGPVTSAVLHVTAHGVVEATLDGAPVGDDVLTPGWSAYEWRLRYLTHDVTDALTEPSTEPSTAAHTGEPGQATHVLGLALGNGWFRGRLGWNGNRAFYGDELAGLAQLEITYADGHEQLVVTDTSWRAGPTCVVANDLYDGQSVDFRCADDAWARPGADLPGWTGVHALALDAAVLEPYRGPAVRRQEVLRPQRVWTSPAGATLVDFGQNLVGWLRFTVRGPAGSEIVLRHAEVLDGGELGVRPLRSAKATDHLVLSGGDDAFEPTRTFHGFRYAEVTGWPGELGADDVEAVVVHSDLRRTGTFACSDPLLDQLHANVVWGLRGNVLDVPTDCPQRDERLGWTGDLAVFAPSAAFLYDVAGFLDDWMADLAAEQRAAHGRVPFVVPDPLKYEKAPEHFPAPESTAIWADAAAWVPWALWQAYGDSEALARHYPAMLAHVDHVASLLSPSGLWDGGFQFGDWLDPQAPPDEPFKARADPGVVATACAYRTASTVAAAARVLGHGDDAERLDALAARVRAAFTEHYVTDDGLVRSDCATVYALAVSFGLLEEPQRARAGERLAALVAADGYRVSTGFAGTPYVTGALSATGHVDEAYRLLLERECPSWLYPVTMGATTVWERWDSMLPDGSINPGEMTSFNHYALGAVVAWMHEVVAGIAPLEPGYRRVLVAPQPGGGLTWAQASLATRHGKLAVRWDRREDGAMDLDVTVPEGVEALVRLPGGREHEVGAGRHRLSAP